MNLITISEALAEQLDRLEFSSPIAHVYNPLRYAWRPHREYLSRYGASGKKVVLLGMNPGPWGMTQTGVPFGEVTVVRDWLQIVDPVDRPHGEHPKKPVLGLECRRSEVSGKRLWGLIRDRFHTPERFFRHYFVLNYCPLLFLDGCGANLTPDKLPPGERRAVSGACDQALRRMIEYLQPEYVIGVGNFAAAQAESALQGLPVTIARILHPSPSSPAANRGWSEAALRQLAEAGVPFQP
ncbi:uracil-DNA glycosylase family protein [Geotalea sp. SG265]|uniref:uracil-DNA glycosylase family protein n=1 Tax=Geotalea sp. SG265 TaxID=2922867 RepID=UPI001FAED046|nr:uracil-DNA glycosylase family protein [Geotalea sp. SG265]